jgi:hypothetical protein
MIAIGSAGFMQVPVSMGAPEVKSFEQMYRDEIKEYPYTVYHPDGEGQPPIFKTWREALQAQKEWNEDIPGHKAMKRRI